MRKFNWQPTQNSKGAYALETSTPFTGKYVGKWADGTDWQLTRYQNNRFVHKVGIVTSINGIDAFAGTDWYWDDVSRAYAWFLQELATSAPPTLGDVEVYRYQFDSVFREEQDRKTAAHWERFSKLPVATE